MSLFKNELKIFFRQIIFYLIFLITCLIPAIPFRISFFRIMFPSFATMLVFHFYVLRKEKISFFILFLFAVIYDVLNHSLLGSTIFIWLISIKIMDYLRTKLSISHNFNCILRDFILFIFLNLSFQWMVISFEAKFAYPVFSLIKQFFLDIVTYVIIYKLLKKMEDFYDA
jgi:cell shape-determining protein MreD